MVFSSLAFLFVFLPVVAALSLVAGRRFRNLALLLASLVFYAWGEGLFVLVMCLSIVVNYGLGLLLDANPGKEAGKRWLWVGVSANLGLLIAFKYCNFLVDTLNGVLGLLSLRPVSVPPVHLPIGISFITFHGISYLVDVYRARSRAQKSIVTIGLYVSLFPQLIAGPIIRFHDVAEQLVRRTVTSSDIAYGIRRFILGLGKKVLIANTLAGVADQIFALAPANLSWSVAWLGAICYALQIFFDFSGYSDMAIGLGRMFGFRFLENFNYPYIAQSIREFWQRWHISLSNWFREYLYFPLGGNRLGPTRTYGNLLVVFFLCGLWHGASWNFILWGGVHGLFLVLERSLLAGVMGRCWRPLRHGYAMLVVLFGWVLFRTETLDAAAAFAGAMVGLTQAATAEGLASYLNREVGLALGVGVVFATPLGLNLRSVWQGQANQALLASRVGLARLTRTSVELMAMASVLAVSISYLAAGAYNPFIYFRF